MTTEELKEKWKFEYEGLKSTLVSFDKDLSEMNNLIEYNLTAMAALKLMECRVSLAEID